MTDAITDRKQMLRAELWPFLVYVGRRFIGENATRVAASLSYTSLLSLVPLMTIGFAMFAAFPVFAGAREKLLAFIIDTLVVQDRAVVEGYFNQFLNAAGGMTAFGIIGLVVTSLLLFSTIEEALNDVFRVHRARSLFMRMLVFWALLTIGPILVGSSFTLHGYIVALTKISGIDAFTGLFGQLTRFLPTLILVLAFALMIKGIPNRPIKTLHALTGGAVAAVLFSILRWLFGLYIVYFPSYKAIYGAISTLPIFLIWMYLSWLVVLFGASFTAALGEWRGLARRGIDEESGGFRLLLALQILKELNETSQEGRGVRPSELLRKIPASDRDLSEMLVTLGKKGYTARTEDGDWVMLRNPATTYIAEIHKDLGLALNLSEGQPRDQGWRADIGALASRADATQADILRVALADLFEAPDET